MHLYMDQLWERSFKQQKCSSSFLLVDTLIANWSVIWDFLDWVWWVLISSTRIFRVLLRKRASSCSGWSKHHFLMNKSHSHPVLAKKICCCRQCKRVPYLLLLKCDFQNWPCSLQVHILAKWICWIQYFETFVITKWVQLYVMRVLWISFQYEVNCSPEKGCILKIATEYI